jgi:hypothetical protein
MEELLNLRSNVNEKFLQLITYINLSRFLRDFFLHLNYAAKQYFIPFRRHLFYSEE